MTEIVIFDDNHTRGLKTSGTALGSMDANHRIHPSDASKYQTLTFESKTQGLSFQIESEEKYTIRYTKNPLAGVYGYVKEVTGVATTSDDGTLLLTEAELLYEGTDPSAGKLHKSFTAGFIPGMEIINTQTKKIVFSYNPEPKIEIGAADCA